MKWDSLGPSEAEEIMFLNLGHLLNFESMRSAEPKKFLFVVVHVDKSIKMRGREMELRYAEGQENSLLNY